MSKDPAQLQLDVATTTKQDVPFVALESTRRQKNDGLGLARDPMDQEQDPSTQLQVPDARFTPVLLTAWFVALLGPFQFGFNIGVTGAVKEDAVFSSHSSIQWSLCVSVFSIGGLVGSLLAGPVGTIWARKRGVLVSTVIYISAGVLMMFSANIYMLMIGRFIIGTAAGTTGIFMPLYIRELSAPNLRGMLGTGYQVAATLGLLFGDVLAFAFSGKYYGVSDPGWRLLVGFSAVIGILQLVLMPFLPESPCWLISANRKKEAAVILARLRGCSDVSIELKSIQDGLEQDAHESQAQVTIVSVLRDRSIRRPIVICCVLQVIQQFSGINAVMFYANQFFDDAGLTNPLVGTTLVGAINFLSTLVALALIDRAGRRPLMIWSCVGMLMAQLVLTPALLNWLPASTTIAVIFVLVFVAFFELGLGPIPWLVVAEMLPPAPRATAMSLATMVQWFFTFVIGMIFPSMQSGLGDYSFVPFTICLALAVWFTLWCVPETKGMSVEEVREEMERLKRGRKANEEISIQ